MNISRRGGSSYRVTAAILRCLAQGGELRWSQDRALAYVTAGEDLRLITNDEARGLVRTDAVRLKSFKGRWDVFRLTHDGHRAVEALEFILPALVASRRSLTLSAGNSSVACR